MSLITDLQVQVQVAAGSAGEEDLIMHCLGSLLRGFVLLAGFMVGQYCLGLWSSKAAKGKKAPASPRKATSVSNAHRHPASAWVSTAGRGLNARSTGKRPAKSTSDDEDAMSTSAGSSSSDGASDVFSSDEDEVRSLCIPGSIGSGRAGRISKSDLLKFRPATAMDNELSGGLKTKHVDQHTKLAPLPDKRSWDLLRAGTQGSTALPVNSLPKDKAKAAPALKPPRKGAPAPKLQAEEANATLSPARVEALLQICCADTAAPVTLSMALGEVGHGKGKGQSLTKEFPQAAQSPDAPQAPQAQLPPWRKRSA